MASKQATRISIGVFVAAGLLSALTVEGQFRGGRGGGPEGGPVRGFERGAPEIGEAMPDVVLFDAEGREIRLQEVLRGRYTVLILGCLT